eukprot:3978620-Pyramimonas_sp.AAC.1
MGNVPNAHTHTRAARAAPHTHAHDKATRCPRPQAVTIFFLVPRQHSRARRRDAVRGHASERSSTTERRT